MDDNVPQPTPTEVAAEPLTDAAARRRAAVLRCCEGRIDAIKASLKSGLPRHPNLCHYDVAKGYCEALPDIVDSESTRDFIACVVYGMAISAIDVKQGSKLLYGAQVALSAYGRDT